MKLLESILYLPALPIQALSTPYPWSKVVLKRSEASEFVGPAGTYRREDFLSARVSNSQDPISKGSDDLRSQSVPQLEALWNAQLLKSFGPLT